MLGLRVPCDLCENPSVPGRAEDAYSHSIVAGGLELTS